MQLAVPCQGFVALCSISLAIACSGADGSPVDPGGVGGAVANTGGTTATGLGGVNPGGQLGTGGATANPGIGGAATGGGTNSGNGGTSSGGSAVGGNAAGGKSAGGTATGGNATGGKNAGGTAIGGTATGGKSAGGTATGGNATGGKNAGGTATGGSAVGGNAAGGKSAGGSATGGKAAGGSASGGAAIGGKSAGGSAAGGAPTASGGAATCSPTWSPPASANGNTGLPAGLDEVWSHSGAVIQAASNIKIHQVMANKGTMRYCVRWDSTTTINATERDQLEALIQKNEKQWWDQLKGWGCWPYTDISTSVTVWAARNRSYLNWDDSTTAAKVVVNSTADCPTDCGTWAPGKTFSSCSSAIYDEFFWLDGTVTTFTGWGSATGFMMGASSFLSSAKSNASTFVILAHEMGHAHGMDDFYDWQPSGWTSWVMNAGSASIVTETDGWMLRDIWRHVRSKYGYPAP